MRIVVDSSVLVFLIYPEAPAPLDPTTGEPVPYCQERIEGLLEKADGDGHEIIIPTPVLSELLIKAPGKETEILAALTGKKAVRILAFDEQAAIENAMLRRSKSARSGKAAGTKNEVKFDLQILAIARVARADVVLTDDLNLRKHCKAVGMPVQGVSDIGVPGNKMQMPIGFTERPAD